MNGLNQNEDNKNGIGDKKIEEQQAPLPASPIKKKSSDIFNMIVKNKIKSKKHYRRGTYVLEQMKAKINKEERIEAKDNRIYEQLQRAYDSDILSKNTVLGISVFFDGGKAVRDPFAVNNMPLNIQVAFRRKLFGLFAIHLFFIFLLIILASSISALSSPIIEFSTHWAVPVLFFTILLLSLGLLYLVKYWYPVNFVALGIFSVAFVAFFISAVSRFNSALGLNLFGFVFVFFVVCGTALLSCRKSGKGDQVKLMGFIPAAFISYLNVLWLSIIFHAVYGYEFMSNISFISCCGVVLLLIMWFAYDASCMVVKMAPEEFMQGVIFFYTDVIIFIIFIGFFIAAIAFLDDNTLCGGEEVISGESVEFSGVGGSGADVAYAVTTTDAVIDQRPS